MNSIAAWRRVGMQGPQAQPESPETTQGLSTMGSQLTVTTYSINTTASGELPTKSLLMWLTFLTVALPADLARSAEEPAAYSAEESIAAVTDRLTTIDSLYCEYSYRFSNSPRPIRCRYARSGVKWHYAELSFDEVRKAHKEKISSYDGDLVYAYVVRRADGGAEHWSSVHLQDPRKQKSPCPDFLLGAKLSNISRSVPDVLASVDITKSEAALPSGAAGVRLSARAVPTARVGPEPIKYDLTLTLDPEHDFLPRGIRITQSDENKTWLGWAQHWKIREYRRVLDERTNRQRWFPTSGVLHQGTTGAPTIEMVVENVRINAALEPTLFRPDIPDGVTLADTTSNGGGRMALKGREFLLDSQMEVLTEKAQDALDAPQWRRWFIILNLLILPGLLLAFALRKRFFT